MYVSPSEGEIEEFFHTLTQQDHYTHQNGENVNPFGAIASMVGDQSGPWTGWIDPAPV